MKSKPFFTVLTVAAISILLGAGNLNASAEDQSNGKEKINSQGQTKENSNQGPQVRLGNPSKTISSDADQQEYDQQDGGIAGVFVLGSRVFETKVSNTANPNVPVPATLNLIKHTGSAMPATHIYSIYWGPSFPMGYADSVDGFLTGISLSSYNSVTTQYMTSVSVPNVMTFGGRFIDSSAPPSSSPTTASILAEVYKVVATNGKQSMDPQGLYMVFTNNVPAKANFCAWHGAGAVGGTTFTIAYQPFLGTFAGCNANLLINYKLKTNVAVDSVANVASHEIYETVTDPLLNAWYDSKGAEIGDKCAWKTATTIAGYSVQTEWDNSTSGCKP